MRKAVLFLLLTVCLFQGRIALGEEATLHSWKHSKKYQYVTFGQYPQLRDGTVLPVKWRVLSVENDQAMLISEYVLDAKQVIFESDPVAIEEHTYRRISTFEESDLFVWLNSTMRDTLFTPAEQSAVINSSRGQVFVLSRSEFLNTDYGFAASVYGVQIKRQCKPTQYAIKQGAYLDRLRTTCYWTNTVRFPEGHQLQIVGYNGHLSYAGYTRADVGLRVSCILDVAQLNIISGKGIKDDPYILSLKQTSQAD